MRFFRDRISEKTDHGIDEIIEGFVILVVGDVLMHEAP